MTLSPPLCSRESEALWERGRRQPSAVLGGARMQRDPAASPRPGAARCTPCQHARCARLGGIRRRGVWSLEGVWRKNTGC
eukprot:1491606-Rhodomonas_salina.2